MGTVWKPTLLPTPLPYKTMNHSHHGRVTSADGVYYRKGRGQGHEPSFVDNNSNHRSSPLSVNGSHSSASKILHSPSSYEKYSKSRKNGVFVMFSRMIFLSARRKIFVCVGLVIVTSGWLYSFLPTGMDDVISKVSSVERFLIPNDKHEFKSIYTCIGKNLKTPCRQKFGRKYSSKHHKVESIASEQTDPSQLYPLMDSNDEKDREIMKHMEMRPPTIQGDCVPMQEWQTGYYPTCNMFHDMNMVDDRVWDTDLFGTKGYFRMAWKVERRAPFPDAEGVVMKTLK